MAGETFDDSAALRDDEDPHGALPPVQPPSAGFILQLFVVPGLIVLVVIGVLALFNKLASEEQDWRELVAELESPNQHVRDRAMFGLAQLLDADRRLGAKGEQLSQNPQIAQPLASQLDAALSKGSQSNEVVTQQVFLSRALGRMDVPEVVFPVLGRAMDARWDQEVRKGAVLSVAEVAGRARERGAALRPEATRQVVQDLVTLSQDKAPVLRQAGAFALGLFDDDAASQRLEVMLTDRDEKAQVNAAIGLARHKSTAGYDVFRGVLTGAAAVPDAAALSDDALAEHLIVLNNSLKAVTLLAPEFDPAQQRALLELLGGVADNHPDAKIRIEAKRARAALGAAG